MDKKVYALNVDDITNIVNALEIYCSVERSLAVADKRDFDHDVKSTLSYMLDFENSFKRSEAVYVELSYGK